VGDEVIVAPYEAINFKLEDGTKVQKVEKASLYLIEK